MTLLLAPAKIFSTGQKVEFEKANNKFIFRVPAGYKNDMDVIIELTLKGSTADMALLKS